MNHDDLLKACEDAKMIVCGYAFSTTENSNIRVLDLNAPHHALVMSDHGDVYETTMDDVEISIVKNFWGKNKKHMEESYAEVL